MAVDSADFQVAVVGGGPAGSRTAALLAKGGLSVVLLEAEQPDNEVLCSGLLNYEAQAALGCDPPASVCLEPHRPMLEYHDLDNKLLRRFDPRYRNISRPAFDAWLRQEAQVSGAVVSYNQRVSQLEPGAGGVRLRLKAGEILAKLVVDATGWRSLSRKVFKASKPTQIHAFQGVCNSSMPDDAMWAIYKSSVTPYYGWVVPKGRGQFLIGAGFTRGADSTRNQQVSPWGKLEPFMDYIRSRGYSVEPVANKPVGSPIACINSMSQLWWGSRGVFTVGEAAGMVSPSSGDGISYCLQGAAALAKVLVGTDFSRLDYTADCLATAQHQQLAAAIRSNMRPALRELNFNIAKAWVAAQPRFRGLGVRWLPMYLQRKVEAIPWDL